MSLYFHSIFSQASLFGAHRHIVAPTGFATIQFGNILLFSCKVKDTVGIWGFHPIVDTPKRFGVNAAPDPIEGDPKGDKEDRDLKNAKWEMKKAKRRGLKKTTQSLGVRQQGCDRATHERQV